jgi:hypothetical protein
MRYSQQALLSSSVDADAKDALSAECPRVSERNHSSVQSSKAPPFDNLRSSALIFRGDVIAVDGGTP